VELEVARWRLEAAQWRRRRPTGAMEVEDRNTTTQEGGDQR
jgi:hypothetical protein